MDNYAAIPTAFTESKVVAHVREGRAAIDQIDCFESLHPTSSDDEEREGVEKAAINPAAVQPSPGSLIPLLAASYDGTMDLTVWGRLHVVGQCIRTASEEWDEIVREHRRRR